MVENMEGLEDEQLLELYSNGNVSACEKLLERYKNLVRKKAHAMYIAGGDSDDLIQEGMIGLYKAVRDYNSQKHASFMTFASMCINRQMCTAVSAANRKKHNPLNTYVSFDAPVEGDEEGETRLIDILSTYNDQNPESLIIDREVTYSLENRLEDSLSDFERQVLKCYINGEGYVQIASKLSKSPKSIDNALQRIKNKLLNII